MCQNRKELENDVVYCEAFLIGDRPIWWRRYSLSVTNQCRAANFQDLVNRMESMTEALLNQMEARSQ